jgi:UDP-3-O-[3-hydroxymyristoyl] N-acetylglucosamine deacetylase
MLRATVASPVEFAGRGLFSGEPCRIRIEPRDKRGLLYRTTAGGEVLAHPDHIQSSAGCTVLRSNRAEIRVIEHLQAALWAADIDSAVITQLDGPEIPNVDGSAAPFYRALLGDGDLKIAATAEARPTLRIAEPLRVGDETAWFELEPADTLSIHYHFDHAELGQQEFRWERGRDGAAEEILLARTFATLAEADSMARAGLLRNRDELAGLLFRDGVPNQPLRFANELARHKVLDLLGDLYVLPFEWPCRLRAFRTGHLHNHLLARILWRLFSA